MSLILKPLADALGAEIAGIELGDDLDDGTFSEILGAWHDRLVLVFRNQQLSTERQIAFASRFGELQKVRTTPGISHDNPHVMMVSNVEADGKKGVPPDGETQFHSDQCYYERSCKLTMLFALEVPRFGGNTLFANEERPEFIYEHVWRVGDLVMWDNRCALHGRTDFDPSERRMLRRVTVRGERLSQSPATPD